MLLTTRGHSYNPASLNRWLTGNGGYEGGDELCVPCCLVFCVAFVLPWSSPTSPWLAAQHR